MKTRTILIVLLLLTIVAAAWLGWLPEIGPTVCDAPQLLAMGIELAGGGRQALDALMPVVDLLDQRSQGEPLSRELPLPAAARPELAAADTRLARAEALTAQVRGPLHAKLAPQLAHLSRLLPLARVGLKGAQVAPSLLGMSGPRTCLVLAQNSDELYAPLVASLVAQDTHASTRGRSRKPSWGTATLSTTSSNRIPSPRSRYVS